ncbi:MAG: DUF1844 domain-containing protein [Deltaproteobacteria bacterium]|nr:DUF1844 domain-containing protein [Deltaproteobacteria bacterium]
MTPSTKTCTEGKEPKAENKSELELPKIDFSTFVVSLSTSALYSLGLAANPETGQVEPPNLEMARQTIDTLELLQVKTRGNLEPEEYKLLESLLCDLHLRFVESRK